MATQVPGTAHPPKLSSFLNAAEEWLGEDYPSSVVKCVLDARDQIPAEVKRALDGAIRSSGVRVPGGGFQLIDVQDAPTHHLQTPVFRKMQVSDELTEAVLRAWVGIQADLYESVVQHLQWNDEPTYGPDRKEMSFRGYWDARDWQTNFNQFLADRTGFDHNDVGLMLWYVSGKLPPSRAESEDPADRVDFERWKELLMALRPDAPQWESALEFAESIEGIVEEKEKQRARDAVNQLKTKAEDIWLEYSDELIYLEKNISLWASARSIQPEEALQTLAQVTNLEELLSQYRPIRDQAQSRSVESSRAGRRAELEAEIINTVAELEPLFSPSGATSSSDTTGLLDMPLVEDQITDEEPAEETGLTEIPNESDFAQLIPADAEPEGQCEDMITMKLFEYEEEAPELIIEADQTPELIIEEEIPELIIEEEETPSGNVNASILAGLRSLREDLDLLKAQLVSTNGTEHSSEEDADTDDPVGPEEQDVEPDVQGLTAVVLQAQEQFPRQLVFRLNSESWVNGNPFEDPQAVADALEWLASSYYAARQGDMDFGQLNDSLYRACRWKYSNNQHDRSFFQNEGHYRMLVNGKAYYLNETIGKGVGEDAVNTIRIAFYWDRQRERVVIGYIGQHQLIASS